MEDFKCSAAAFSSSVSGDNSNSDCFCSSCMMAIVLFKVAQMRLLVSFCSTATVDKRACKVLYRDFIADNSFKSVTGFFLPEESG